MADNKVKQIVDTVKTTVTGLATTLGRVSVHRSLELAAEDVPALNIRVGPLSLIREHQTTQDWELTVFIEAYVLGNINYWENQLLIQKEVHVAMRDDYTLGLSFVHNTMAAGFEDGIVINPEGDKVSSNLIHEWNIFFTASIDDISA